MSELFRYLDKMARCAGDIALQYQRNPPDFAVETKGHHDFLTAADQSVEQTIIGLIRKEYPDDALLGEEVGFQTGQTARTWIIDPIDGTANYMRGFPWWSISIGLIDDGWPVAGIIHAPAMGITLVAVNGHGVNFNGEPFVLQRPEDHVSVVMTGASPKMAAEGEVDRLSLMVRTHLQAVERRLGCGTASLVQVLLGHADLYVGLGERIWDVCAAAVIAEELGLRHSVDWRRRVDCEPFNFLCGQPDLIDRVTKEIFSNAVSNARPWQGLFGHRNSG